MVLALDRICGLVHVGECPTCQLHEKLVLRFLEFGACDGTRLGALCLLPEVWIHVMEVTRRSVLNLGALHVYQTLSPHEHTHVGQTRSSLDVCTG